MVARTLTADKALERLKEGNKRYREDRPVELERAHVRRRELVRGQAPSCAILCCSDSRVAPEIVFDAGLGELFVVRLAGNVACRSSIGSLEFAVQTLGTRLVVVLGHENCGAVQAMLAGSGDASAPLPEPGFQPSILARIRPALADGEAAGSDQVIRRHACLTAERLRADSPILGPAVARDGVRIEPAYYSLQTGEVAWLPGLDGGGA